MTRSYVLVHGGGTTARFWDRLLPLLDGPSVTVDLPGRAGNPADLGSLTVEDEVASVVRDVEAAALDDPLVLVAHSSGGLVVPGVLRELTARGRRVDHVVLNAASVPPEGGCGLDCMQPRHREGVQLAVEMARDSGRPLVTLGPPDDAESFRKSYGPPLTDEDLEFVVDPARCVVDTMSHYLQPVSWAGAPAVPVTYVINLRDRPIPTELQREMAARLPRPPTIVELDTGHIPPITDPATFYAVLTALP